MDDDHNGFFKKILESTSKNICVIAAPGSGKTSRILIPKAKAILSENDIDPNKVLILTFSRLSALDLKEQVKTFERTPKTSTVHSYCLSFLLSEDNHDIKKRVETILLDFEKQTLLWDIKLIFPQIHKTKLERLLEEFSAGWATKPHDETFEETSERQSFKSAVISWLSEYEAVLMEEIVYHAVDLAKKLGNSKLIDEPQYIFVDEFQDLNKLEQEFIQILAKDSKLFLVVGDPDQSIYSFKFAYREGIDEFAQRDDVENHEWLVTGRCPKKIIFVANQLLKQSNPGRNTLLQPLQSTVDGELHLVRKNNQDEEFDYVLSSIKNRFQSGVKPPEIIILVPKKKLGVEFAKYANDGRVTHGIPQEIKFSFVSKCEFSDLERERILLFGLLVNPKSLAHIRSFLGLGDDKNFAPELKKLKQMFGDLFKIVYDVNPEVFPKRSQKMRSLCDRIEQLRIFLNSQGGVSSLDRIFEELFPETENEVTEVRNVLLSLKEEGDDPKKLYAKFIDYMKTLPSDSHTIRIMTLMASKGLEADHVYIMGCNAGNIPGSNRSLYLEDHQYREEQRRLLYVGFTRAKKSLTVSWSQYIPFRQSRGHHTQSIGTARFNNRLYSKVGISEFLQDLQGVSWET